MRGVWRNAMNERDVKPIKLTYILTKHLKQQDNLRLFMFSARCLTIGSSRAKVILGPICIQSRLFDMIHKYFSRRSS